MCRCNRKVSQGWCGAGLCRRGIAAAEQWRRNAGDGVLATKVAYMPLQRAQKEEGCQEVLTEGSWWPELLRRVEAGEVERRRWAELAVRWCRAPPGLWVARFDARRLYEAGRGVSGIWRSTAARKFDGGAFSPELMSGAIPTRRGPRPSVESPGRVLVLRRG